MKKLWIPALFLLLAVVAAALFLGERNPPAHAPTPEAKRHVAAEGKVEAMPGYDVNLGTGELNGKVARILVREGELVAAGQLVAVLENADLRAQVVAAERGVAVARSRLREVQSGARAEEIRQAAAALDAATAARSEAEQQWRRQRELRAQGMVSPAALDERERVLRMAEAQAEETRQRKLLLEAGARPETVRLHRDQVALAQAGLEHARQLLDKTLLRAPIAGTVIKRYLDEGEGVTPEIPILAIADLKRVWINAEVDETDIGRVTVGDAVEVRSDAWRGTTWHGRVIQIADYAGERRVRPNDPAVNLGMKVVQVKIELEGETPLRLGMTVDVRIAGAGSMGSSGARSRVD